jgi:Protein of unknown function (DUF2442)
MKTVLVDVAEVRAVGGHRLYLRFADGVEGLLDLDGIVRWEGVFAPLRDPERFAEVRVDAALGTIVWPNGADLDPDVLYATLSGRPLDIVPPAVRS